MSALWIWFDLAGIEGVRQSSRCRFRASHWCISQKHKFAYLCILSCILQASSRWEWNMQREFVYRCEVGLVMTSVSGRHQETPLPGGRSLWRVLVSPGCCRAGRLGHAPRNRPGALSSLGVLQRLTALLTTHTFVIFSRSLWCTVSLCGYVGWL